MKSTSTRIKRAKQLVHSNQLSRRRCEIVANWLERAVIDFIWAYQRIVKQ